MARIRSIKPDLFMDDGLSEVSIEAHFLLAGLPCIADSAGRLEDRPRRIQAQIFPYRPSVNVDACLDELARSGHVQRYTVGGVRYLQVENWESDQRPHVKEAPSAIPPPLDSTEHRKGSELAGNSPGTRQDKSAEILDLGSGVLGSEIAPPESAPRNELRLEPLVAAKRTRSAKREDKPTDPRHAPLCKALESAGWPHHGGRTAKAVAELLALADRLPPAQLPAGEQPAFEEVLRRARLAMAHEGFPRVRELHELARNWGHFESAPAPGRGPAPPSDFARPAFVPERSPFAPEVSDEPF